MANEFETKIIQGLASDIATRLNEAVIIAKVADEFGDCAFQSLLEIEPLIYEANVLLNATSVVRRRERERCIDPN